MPSAFIPLDTIPAGRRLVPAGPRICHPSTPKPGLSAVRKRRALRLPALSTEITNRVRELRTLITLHNKLAATLPRELRAALDITRINLYYDDASQIATPMAGLPAQAPPRPQASKAELREEARRRRVPLPMLWDRFPPDSLYERRVMQRELSAYWQRQAPAAAKATKDDFSAYLTRQAKEAAKLARDPSLAGRLLASSEWKARQRANYDSLMSIELDLDL